MSEHRASSPGASTGEGERPASAAQAAGAPSGGAASAGGSGPSSAPASGADASVTVPAGGPEGKRPVPGSAHDWTVDVADRIESVVGAVRGKTTVPIVRGVRVAVFGLVAAPLALLALIFFLIGLFRLVEVYLPIEPYSARVWGTYAVAGAIFVLVGLLLFSRRPKRRD